MHISNYSYSKERGEFLDKFEVTETFRFYSFKERFDLMSKIITGRRENFWKRFKIVLFGYETINITKRLISSVKIPNVASDRIARMTYSTVEQEPMKY